MEEGDRGQDRWSLKGMNALVTGGARGIGYAIVEELAGLGARVHTCSRTKNELNQSLEEWKAKGYEVTVSVCDLSSKTQREHLIHTVTCLFQGKLDILINNAGIGLAKMVLDHTEEDFSNVLKINLESPFHLSRMAHPLLKTSGRGSIVFVSSVGGSRGLPGFSAYGASKGAINQLTRSLAYEWARDNIRVNTIAPWVVKTRLVEVYVNSKASSRMINLMFQGGNDDNDKIMGEFEPIIARTPLRRVGEADEVSPMAAFLCLPVASYITGQVYAIDGGFSSCG